MLIRIAQPSDAEQLAILAERTFRDTFASSNTPEDMELHCQSSYSKEHQLKEIQNPNWITLVCECENMLAGYAQMRWEEFPSCVEAKTPREILCFYVDKPWHIISLNKIRNGIHHHHRDSTDCLSFHLRIVIKDSFNHKSTFFKVLIIDNCLT